MEIVINGQRQRVAEGISLERAVALVTSAPSGIAVAVNGAVVRRSSWGGTVLAPGDEVEVLTAVQGGLRGRPL